MPPEAAVIVPAYAEADRLPACLDALAGQDCTLVVVAGGADGTAAMARAHDAVDVVVADDGRGAGAARNQGVAATDPDDCEVVCFTDADTQVPEDWVATHRRHYEDPAVAGVGGPAAPLEPGLGHRVGFRIFSDYWYRVSWPVGFVQLPTFNCSYRRDVFDSADGFDESIPFMEDTELSLRVKDAGRFVYDTDTRVRTSVRREAEGGYVGTFLTYARAYFAYYVLGREFSGEYFDSSDG